MLPQRALTLVLLQDEGRKASQKIFLPGVNNSWCQGSPLNCPCVYQPSGLSAQYQLIPEVHFLHTCVWSSAWSISAEAHGSGTWLPSAPRTKEEFILRVLPNWMVVLWLRRIIFLLLSPRPCSSLNLSAACHYIGSPVTCFITIPGQGQLNPWFSELRRLTEKSKVLAGPRKEVGVQDG